MFFHNALFKRLLKCLLIIGSLATFAGCSPLSVLNTVVSDTGFVVTRDVYYGEQLRQKLDIYVPVESLAGANKVVVFFYGGRWQEGRKEDYRFVAEALTAQNFVVVIIDYRLYPEVRFPEFVRDAAQAVRWVRSNIQNYSGNPERIYLLGHSAGAHIVALLNLDERYLKADTIRAAIGLAGPYDFLPLESADLEAVFSGGSLSDSQPINFVDGTEPPMLLLSGADDKTVNPGNSLRLAARIRAKGGSVQVILYPDVDHGFIIGALAAPLQEWAPTLRDITAFIRAY